MVKIFKANQAKKNTNTHSTIALSIDKFDINGVGIGRYKGKPAFVEYALPDEKVQAKVISSNSKLIKAKLLSVDEVSEQRAPITCKHFYLCGGCDLQHLTMESQLNFKQDKVNQLFARQGLCDLPWQTPLSEQPWYYRRKARIGVQYDKNGQAIIGFRKKLSNDITPIKQCHVLAKAGEYIFSSLKQVLSQLTQRKAIGHIEVIFTEQVHLVIRQLKTLSTQDKQIWLQAAQQNQWQLYIDDGQQTEPLTSTPSLSYCLDDIKLSFKPQHFIQVNAGLNQLMVAQAIAWLSPNSDDRVLDLFCGLGNFSLAIASKVDEVVGVEGINEMVQQASENAVSNNIANCHFYQANLNDDWQQQAFAQGHFSTIILDPARAGALQACQQLVKFNAKKILYVSCEPKTLAADAAFLTQQGYKIEKIQLIDMFSQTKHVETMVLFHRISP